MARHRCTGRRREWYIGCKYDGPPAETARNAKKNRLWWRGDSMSEKPCGYLRETTLLIGTLPYLIGALLPSHEQGIDNIAS